MRKIHNIGNLNTEIETKINRSSKKVKSTVMEGDNPLDKINSRYKMAEEKRGTRELRRLSIIYWSDWYK